jgi:hypothetical protein
MLISKLVKIPTVYLSPSRPLFASDLSVCLGGGLSILMAKHLDWDYREIKTRDRFLRDYANENSCLIYGPSIPTTVPHNSSATPDALDIVITKDLVTTVYLSTCSALSSNHFPVLIDT